MKTTITLIIVIVILLASVSGLGYLYNRQLKITDRVQSNYELSQNDLERFKDDSGRKAIKLKETQLTLAELKESKDSTIQVLYKEARALRVKNRQLDQLLSAKVNTVYDSIFVPIHDTVIKGEQSRIAAYKDRWLDIDIRVNPSDIEILRYTSSDEIVVVVHWYKERKFFISRWFESKKWGASIKSINPNSEITTAKNIKITKQVGR